MSVMWELKEEHQVKAQKRVKDHGEVFTSQREVVAMLDQFREQAERIESRFLEPACGNGNFLVEILRRKLNRIRIRYAKSQLEYERNSIAAISSVYGIDILPDNVTECQDRLYFLFNREYASIFGNKCKDECRKSARFILEKNILLGDALSLLVPKTKEPIVFSEWSFVQGSYIKRRDYAFEELSLNRELDLFSQTIVSDSGNKAFIPKPIKEFPLTHYLNIHEFSN